MEFRKILVPVTGTDIDEGVMELATSLLAKKDKGSICAVHIIPMERTLPLDAEIEPRIRKADDILTHIESFAEEKGYKIEADLLQSREAGLAIVNEAIEQEADLIIMGLPYKTRFGVFSLGDVVPYVLKNTPCRVMIYYETIAS